MADKCAAIRTQIAGVRAEADAREDELKLSELEESLRLKAPAIRRRRAATLRDQ